MHSGDVPPEQPCNIKELDGTRGSREVLQDAPSLADAKKKHGHPQPHYTPKPDGFDMEKVAVFFERSIGSSADVNMDSYILAYRELERLLELMGSVFGFVGSDVKDKLGILCKHRASPSDGSRYSTIKQMLLYETSSPELLEPLRTSKNSTLPSASRTLLRLHRALRFIMMFMEGLISAADDESVARLAQESYKNSLAAFHPWLIRTGAHCAMYTLGTKYQMMEKVSKHSYAEVTKFAKKMTVAMKPVYDKTEQLYSEFNLHGLP